ncbi:MAG TPA: DNA-formamidopyrimidine glycosylase family protein [Pseudoxanthomonas sp.]|nr:DNA-formamidopyrimidine glycosylase family protein [Pseudoxanthomonas sp.]
MPEGPSIVILRERAEGFAGKRVLDAGGNTRTIDPIRMKSRTVRRVASWGKHFLIQFDGFVLRVHFMLFGSYTIDEDMPGRAPRLQLRFAGGRRLNLYACSVRYLEGAIDELYDFGTDVMSDSWNPRAALRALRAQPETLACDALLDQDVFSGVGNIIKNEVLFRIRVHPESRIGALPPAKLRELVKQAREYSFDFYHWKKAYVLRKHYQVHTRTQCPRDGTRLSYAKALGRKQRRAFWCPECQRLYR